MAGGIDWFRWHHGSVTDPKFQLVARKAGASLPDVLAVWAYLLERASSAEFRGCFGEIDCEAVDCLFGFDDGVTDSVMGQMVARQLIADQCVIAWDKRQPKREDETANDRKRRQREREHEAQIAEMSRAVTQGHADVTHGHARGEESREEQIQDPPPASLSVPPAKAPRASRRCPEDFTPSPDLVAEVAAPGVNVARELAKFRDHTFKTARSDWPATFRNWLRDAADRAKPAGGSFLEAKQAEGAKWFKGTSFDRSNTIDMESSDAAQLAIR